MNINRILVAGQYEEEFQRQLPNEVRQQFRYKQIDDITEEDLQWADAYVGSKPCANFHPSKVKWVHTFNAGVNNFLELKGWENVKLTRTVCSFGERISEYCLSYILQDLQSHHFFKQMQLERNWHPRTPKMIKDLTIAVFGTGEIGQKVGETFQHFGATVYGVSKSGKQNKSIHKVVKTSDASTIVNEADWIISTLPLTDDTKHLFNEQLFQEMDGVGFINVGRGATVDEEALVNALNNGRIRLAVLDVLTTEPLPASSPLWEREDIMITPHISAVTELPEAVACFVDTLQKLERNEPLSNEVDFSKGY